MAGLPVVVLLLVAFGQQSSAASMLCACLTSDDACALLVFLPVCASTSLMKAPTAAHAFAVSFAAT